MKKTCATCRYSDKTPAGKWWCMKKTWEAPGGDTPDIEDVNKETCEAWEKKQ